MLFSLFPPLKSNHLNFGEPIKSHLSVDSHPGNDINQTNIKYICGKQEFLATSIFHHDYSSSVFYILSHLGLKGTTKSALSSLLPWFYPMEYLLSIPLQVCTTILYKTAHISFRHLGQGHRTQVKMSFLWGECLSFFRLFSIVLTNITDYRQVFCPKWLRPGFCPCIPFCRFPMLCMV